MAELKIGGDIRITDGNIDLRTLKELNIEITKLNNIIDKLIPITLYNNGVGTKSATISDLSNYKYLDIEIRTVVYKMKTTIRYYLDTLPDGGGSSTTSTTYIYNGNFVMCFLAYEGCLQELFGTIVKNEDTISIEKEHYINHYIGSNTIVCNPIDRMVITKILGYKK